MRQHSHLKFQVAVNRSVSWQNFETDIGDNRGICREICSLIVCSGGNRMKQMDFIFRCVAA